MLFEDLVKAGVDLTTLDEENQIKLISVDVRFIKFIKNPSISLQKKSLGNSHMLLNI